MKRTLLGLSALMLFTTSCKKEETPPVTKENLLGTYKWVSVTAKVGSMPEQDIMNSYIEECQRDNTMTLKSDDTYAETDAGVQCSSSTMGGTWSLNGSTKFVLDGEEYNVVSFDGKTLKLNQTDNSMGQSMTLNVTVQKQ